ncbi:MAG: J domain-containing protein [Pseudomonadota bacterium]
MVLSEALLALLTNNWFAKALLVTMALVATDLVMPEPAWLTLLVVAIAFGLGHELDQLARARLSPSMAEASDRQLLLDLEQQDPWSIYALCAMGRLATIDGPLLPAHRQLAEEILARLSPKAGEDARAFTRRGLKWFHAGRREGCPFSTLAAACGRARDTARTAAAGEALVLECLGRAAQVRESDAVSAAMGDLATLLRYHLSGPASPRPGVAGVAASTTGASFGGAGFGAAGTGSGAASTIPLPSTAERQAAAELLNVPVDASSEAIRLAYRRGVARYHPDRLPQNASAYDVAMAEEQMTRFRDAYERLLAGAVSSR